jgi:hypothetical protein
VEVRPRQAFKCRQTCISFSLVDLLREDTAAETGLMAQQSGLHQRFWLDR